MHPSKRLLLTFGVVPFLLGLPATGVTGPHLTWLSAAFLMAFAAPSYYFLLRHLPTRRALAILVFFSLFPIAVELAAVTTRLPYGAFQYTGEMGYRLGGIVPWTVAFVFAPLLLGGMRIASSLTPNPRLGIPVGASVLVLHDMVLDPVAVEAGFWVWADPGPYFGVPVSNFMGWLLIGLLASAIMHVLTMDSIGRLQALPPGTAISLFATTCFWAGSALWSGMLLPSGIGLGLAALAFYSLAVPAPPPPAPGARSGSPGEFDQH